MKKSTGIMQPMCCSDKNAVIESKIDPHSVVKGEQKRWNFYKRNKNRKKMLVDQAEQCDEVDIQKCLSDNVVAVPKKSSKDKIHKENERFTADLHKLIQNNSQTIDPYYDNSNQNQMPATVNNFMIHMNGQQYNNVPYNSTKTTTTSPANNIFIVQTENNHTRITIVQASEPPRTIFHQPRIEEVESEGDLSHDSLDDLVMGHFEYREKAVDVPDNFEPDSLMINNSLEDIQKEQSPFKRRLNAPPLRQSRGLKNKTKTNPHQYFHRDKDAYNRQWISTQQLDSSTLDRNSILHWSGDDTPKFNPSINFNPIPERNPGTLNRRNANSLKKLGISCQNLSSGRNSPERNISAKSLSKNLSKSEHDLCRKTSTDSTTGIKASASRFDIMTKFFSFNKNNKIEPITSIPSSVEIPKAGVMDFTKRAERVGWMKNISNYFAKKTRRSSDRIQDLDGGFFERFGSLLQQAESKHEEVVLAAIPQVEALPEQHDDGGDSGVEIAADSDSEQDSEQAKADKSVDFIETAVGWNLEELYEEIIFETLHNIGREDEDLGDDVLFRYLQDCFKFSNDKHETLLEQARSKEAPEIRLNVEVIEAKDLKSMDPNGLADPFVTLYIESNPSHRYNTSVKATTLTPKWEEHFSLPISEEPNNENLIIEVWDFDPAETIKEKVGKVFDVKGVKGIRRLLKEIAVTSYAGSHKNELIGKTYVPLKTIPASGIVMWYSLDKKGKTKRTGLVKIRINFSSQKNTQVAMQEHRHLLKILLLHELETSKVAPFWWSGKFSNEGDTILTQHAAQSGLTQTDIALSRWSVFCEVHCEHPLAFSLFDGLLDKIVRVIQSRASPEEVRVFWESTKKLLPSCMNTIRKLRKSVSGDKNTQRMVAEALSIISKVAMIQPPEDFDLFPAQLYGWLPKSDTNGWDIRTTLTDAVRVGAENWFLHITEQNPSNYETNEERLQHLIKIIQLVRSDLQRAIEHYDKIFREIIHFHYTRELYNVYEALLADMVQPEVLDVCRSLKRIHLQDDQSPVHVDNREINMGTTLFELYLVLKRFVVLGTGLTQTPEEYKITNYYQWFTAGVSHWLDISLYKAMTRIKKAIELDTLAPVDDSLKMSSSAVDTLAIFHQIKIFWHQLGWPDIEGSYMFVGKIVDDICQCCVFYANKMSERVDGLGNVTTVYEQKFEVTPEWCLAINNIDYIRQNLMAFVKELGIDDIIKRMSDFKSPGEAERCAQTLTNVTENAIDTEKNKILELIETVAKKMSPQMKKFLQEGAEVLHEDSNSMDRLMLYMEDSLTTLNAELNETNFQRILDAIWLELSIILLELVQTNLDKRRPPSFFQNLHKTLRLMVRSFKNPGQDHTLAETQDIEVLQEVTKLLDLHGQETAELVHSYYKERVKEQKLIDEPTIGQLTIQTYFNQNTLELEVLSARNLRPMDASGTSDSYVRVNFIPEEKFTNINKPKTNVLKGTLFPLYEEKFSIPLAPEQRAMNDAIIVFCVKETDMFGVSHRYNAECYLSFNEITDITGDNGKVQQLLLPLTRPSKSAIVESDCLRALELRQGDKQAKEFMKKLKQKMNEK